MSSKKSAMEKMLKQYKNGEININNVMNRIHFKDKIPEMPYFRKTKSGAIAMYGIKREPIVLYRGQWLKLSRVFKGGQECAFNKFFHYKTYKKNIDEKNDIKNSQMIEKNDNETNNSLVNNL